MTQKLYYENQYIKEFTAEILNIIEKDKEFHIELDKTAFFPGGGGQPWDIGKIEDSVISYVYEKDGITYHVSDKKPIKIHKAKCSINWDFRFDGMQQHLGQHVLSAAFIDAFGCNTVGFHLGKDICTIDLDKLLSDEDLEKVEDLANNYIFDNKKVEFLFPSKSELKKLSLRKIPSINDPLRIVKIEDVDITACCGLHPKSTLELQAIKILKKEKYKGNMRLEFTCGKRAIMEAFKKYKFSNRLCKTLNCNEDEALIKVNTITNELNSLKAENKNLKSQIADFEVQNILNTCDVINNIRIVKNIYVNTDIKYVNLLASKLVFHENVIVLFGMKSEAVANLLFMCSKNIKGISMNDLLKDAISLIDGKGGGSPFSAQGGGKSINNLESSIDYAYSKVNTLLLAKK
ncbi:alanyl-tRNA editing protein [Candidatus Clostridium radicumherbarum]|uniref:Alanyl-tRNA editing protein n=1 Tax=Candidatus Clostridium radicumherbarum TaxID=3381662 RepID=A0ABW8TMV4_9CLOT